MTISKNPLNFVNYLFEFTDDVGIFQHSHFGIPNRDFGYTTDDNCRALILAVMLYEKFKDRKYISLINTYLSFVHHAQNQDGKFKNFMSFQRNFIEDVGSEDCFGRCFWALSYTYSIPSVPHNIKNACMSMLELAKPNIESINSPRAKAYVLIGLGLSEPSKERTKYVKHLASSLAGLYEQYRTDYWHWFEDIMAYSNAILPRALLISSQILKNDTYLDIATESMRFLEASTFKDNYFKPIGCDGWFVKGNSPAIYDEQPIEACETLFTYIDYYQVSQSIDYLDKALTCFNWYSGENIQGKSLLDNESGACFDGLTPKGLNLNQGSESILSYGMSYMQISGFLEIINKNIKRHE